MRADVEKGDPDVAKGSLEVRAQRRVPRSLATHAHVRHVEIDERGHVSGVGVDGVARRELANLFVGEEPLDRGDRRVGARRRRSAHPSALLRASGVRLLGSLPWSQDTNRSGLTRTVTRLPALRRFTSSGSWAMSGSGLPVTAFARDHRGDRVFEVLT